MTKYIHSRKGEAGFTLVELAIVMVIIGLLIGGVLKGQELINNARMKSVMASVGGTDAAATGFFDKFDEVAGDMAAAAGRIPGCAGSCVAPAANAGNGVIDNVPDVATAGLEGESFWAQLDTADFISGYTNGDGGLESSISGVFFQVGESPAGAAADFAGIPAAAAPRAGIYLTVSTVAAGGIPAGALEPNQAAQVDRKIDDGDPTSGTVLSGGNEGAAGAAGVCSVAAAAPAPALYNEADNGTNCTLYMRIQG